ncbi:MAG: DUF2971 domain-containing protein [Bacteroidia bacterium]
MHPDYIEILTKDYIENVLIHIFPDAITNKAWSSGMSISGKTFSIEISNDSIIRCAQHYKPTSQSFVHFTSLQGMDSILREQSLRMYNLNNVNDPNEISFTLIDLGSTPSEIKKIKDGIYVLSMVDSVELNKENILNLWRLYGRGGEGVAIELEIIDEGFENNFVLANIIYDKLNLELFLESNNQFETRNNLIVNKNDVLAVIACLHKNTYYKIENEIRLIHNSEDGYSATQTFNPNSHFGRDFNHRNEIGSYYKLKIHKNEKEIRDMFKPNVVIKKIQIGFKHKQRFQEIKEYFEELKLAFWVAKNRPVEFDIELSPLGDSYR